MLKDDDMYKEILIQINHTMLELLRAEDPGCMVKLQFCRAMLRHAIELFGKCCLESKRSREQPSEMFILYNQIKELNGIFNDLLTTKALDHLKKQIGKKKFKELEIERQDWIDTWNSK